MNTHAINQTALNQNTIPLDSNNFINFASFDGFSLSDCGDVIVKQTDYDNLGNVDLQTYNSPFQDWGGELSSYITDKVITISLSVNKNTEQEFVSFLDELKRSTSKQGGKLIMSFGGELRYNYATLTSMTVVRSEKNRAIAKSIDMSFTTKTPHFIAVAPKTSTDDITTLSYPLDLNNIWSEESYYNIDLIFNAGTVGLTKCEIVKDWYTLTVTNTFTAGDILEINGETKTVKKNTVIIPYTGIFVDLKLWSNPMQVVLTGTSVNATLNTKFLIRYR